jgi:DNA-binding XRE family transcriptional regulator
MEMHIETYKIGRTPYVQMPASEFNYLLDELEDLRDIRTIRAAKIRLADGEETLPSNFVYALAKATTGERVRLWRKHRKLTRNALAETAGVQGPYISMIENGQRKGDISLYRKLASALDCDIDDLI